MPAPRWLPGAQIPSAASKFANPGKLQPGFIGNDRSRPREALAPLSQTWFCGFGFFFNPPHSHPEALRFCCLTAGFWQQPQLDARLDFSGWVCSLGSIPEETGLQMGLSRISCGL